MLVNVPCERVSCCCVCTGGVSPSLEAGALSGVPMSRGVSCSACGPRCPSSPTRGRILLARARKERDEDGLEHARRERIALFDARHQDLVHMVAEWHVSRLLDVLSAHRREDVFGEIGELLFCTNRRVLVEVAQGAARPRPRHGFSSPIPTDAGEEGTSTDKSRVRVLF
jgi:hypothetical protein